MPLDEAWSWKKFFKGFVSGKNYAKAIVLMFCGGIILILTVSTYAVLKSKFTKAIPTQSVGTNSGTVSTVSTDKEGNTWSLFNIFNWR